MKMDARYAMNPRVFRLVSRLVVFVSAAALVWGCSGPTVQEKKDDGPMFVQEWREKAESSGGYSPSRETIPKVPPATPAPRSLEDATADRTAEPPKPPEVRRRALSRDEINMKMHNVQIAVLLKALARIANENIMINENVQGTASINIQSAPWDQVFVGLLKTNGLDYRWEGDIIRIVTVADLRSELELQKETQSFELRIEEYKRDLNSLKTVNEPMQTRVVPVRFSDLEPIKNTVETVLSARRAAAAAEAGEQETQDTVAGQVMLDEHSHSLVIHARQTDMVNLTDLIESLDRPTPQIRIEAHVVEATQRTARSLGVQWGGLFLNASGDNFNWFGADTADTGQNLYNSPQEPNWLQPSTGNVVDALPLGIARGASLAYQYQKTGIGVLSVQLKALQADGELNILSSPSITTVDNQQAAIKSGREYPYQTVEDGEVKIEFKEAVLSLEVTPHVIDNRILRLKILTKNDELDFTTGLQQPAITTKEASTTVFLYDGQTTVIGGLSKNNVEDREEGVPGLKELPLLGYLFKGETKSREFQDLMIFITPHILKQRVNVGETGVPTAAPPSAVQ